MLFLVATVIFHLLHQISSKMLFPQVRQPIYLYDYQFSLSENPTREQMNYFFPFSESLQQTKSNSFFSHSKNPTRQQINLFVLFWGSLQTTATKVIFHFSEYLLSSSSCFDKGCCLQCLIHLLLHLHMVVQSGIVIAPVSENPFRPHALLFVLGDGEGQS